MHHYRYSVIIWKSAQEGNPTYGHGGLQTDSLEEAKIEANICKQDCPYPHLKHGVMDMQIKEVAYEVE
jgi:hypothetical protein